MSDALVASHPDYPEGRLSKLKAHLVSASHLHAVAARLRLGDYLLLGRGEEMSGGREKKALLANAVEALIAALYLDGGIEPARRFIVQHVIGEAEPSIEVALATDYKSALAGAGAIHESAAAALRDRGGARAGTREDFSGGSARGAGLGKPCGGLVEEERRAESGAGDTAPVSGVGKVAEGLE